MEYLTLTVFFVINTLCPKATADILGPWCFHCTGQSNPAECGRVVQCQQGEKCFTERYGTVAGNVLFNAGCERNDVCRKYHKRDYFPHHGGDVPLCKACCSGNICNARSCLGAPLIQDGPACLSCDAAESPDRCQNVRICHQGEMCHWTKKRSHLTNKFVYEMGCLKRADCYKKDVTFCCSKTLCNSNTAFSCEDNANTFINSTLVCDGKQDCPNGTDEGCA